MNRRVIRRAHPLTFHYDRGAMRLDPPFHEFVAVVMERYHRLGARARLVFDVGAGDTVTYDEVGYVPQRSQVIYRRARVHA